MWEEKAEDEVKPEFLKDIGYIRQQNEMLNDFHMCNSIMRCFIKEKNHIQGAKELIDFTFQNNMTQGHTSPITHARRFRKRI